MFPKSTRRNNRFEFIILTFMYAACLTLPLIVLNEHWEVVIYLSNWLHEWYRSYLQVKAPLLNKTVPLPVQNRAAMLFQRIENNLQQLEIHDRDMQLHMEEYQTSVEYALSKVASSLEAMVEQREKTIKAQRFPPRD